MKKVTLKQLQKDLNLVVLQKAATKDVKGGTGAFIVVDDFDGL